ncbi:hypothetical protein TRFO_15209 [Tritrichomonas foetus]|uniref:Uncharacterized protein n=1 Tax=Tritrichomonas foetus TaxID=1144522 RepID=A0A1J4KT45_9EUKA|nr:hypothetical protein TRFO_15209 [Tritrichomonas foetus]|eukprot:OHT14427.1 hypothetical protein TRFO_15209 [Tritrichomonas foetus]
MVNSEYNWNHSKCKNLSSFMNDVVIFNKSNPPLEKYSEPVSILFYYQGSCISVIHVPTLKYISETKIKNPDLNIKFDLLKGDYRWRDAILALENYLVPYRIGDIKKINSPTLTYKISIEIFVPLYYLSRKLNFSNLSKYLEISLYSMNQQNIAQIFLQSYEYKLISFSEMNCQLSLILEAEPPIDFYLKSLHFAEVIITLQKKKHHKFVCNWLLSVFEEFSKSRDHFSEVQQLIQNLPVLNSNFAYTIWIFSQFFPSVNGKKVFLPVINEFDFDSSLPLSEDQILWVFENRTNKIISPKIISLVVPYVRSLSKTNPQICSKLFHSVISLNSFDPKNLQTEQIIDLLPLSAHPLTKDDEEIYDNIFNQLSNELKERGISSFLIKNNQKLILTLNWNQLFNTFHIDDAVFIEICYKWLKKYQDFDHENLTQFNSLLENVNEWTIRYPYMIFRIFDLLFKKNQKELTLIIREKLFTSNFEELFQFLLEKNKILSIHKKTLDSLHERTKMFKNEQILFISIIKNFQIENFNHSILLPIYKETFSTTLNLINQIESHSKSIQSENDAIQSENRENANSLSDSIINEILNVGRSIFGSLPISDIISLSKLIPFNSFFSQGAPVNSMNEDKVLFYATLSQNYEPLLINVPQLSFRTVSSFFEPVQFQFDPKVDSFSKLISKNKVTFDFNKWLTISIPRFVYHSITTVAVFVMSDTNQNFVNLLKRSFDFVGIRNIRVIFPDQDKMTVPDDCPILLIKPLLHGIDFPLKSMIAYFMSRKQPFAMNANAFKAAIHENPQFMPNLLTFDHDNLTKIEWNEPSPGFLPSIENLPILPLNQIADIYYHSICCQNHRLLAKQITMKNGRLFAMKIDKNFSIFNYDIAVHGDEKSAVYWGCIKQMALTTLSLFYNFEKIELEK